MLHEIWMAATRKENLLLKALGKFVATHQAKYPKAVECVLDGKDEQVESKNSPPSIGST
jgi:hypothetical protein